MASEQVIPVSAGGQRYDVIVRRGLLDHVGQRVRSVTGATRAALIADANVAGLYLEKLRVSLASAGIEAVEVIIPPGEESKSLTTLSRIYDALLPRGIERSTPIIALGGGMTTDLAGFAAATLLRGLPFIPVPTSLLAMVDASIGGKTAINHAAGKNLIGAFHQPTAVLIDPELLTTLPPRELRNGLAEVIKHYIIRNAIGFARLEERIDDVLRPEIDLMSQIIAENVAIKAAVVEADPLEQGVRAHLNFGHTFGHAFEHASNYALSHGEAVALGMCAAMHAATALGMVGEPDKQRVTSLVARAGLPTRTGAFDIDAALAAMRSDKKIAGARLRFVLTDRIGSVVVRDDVPEAVIRSAIEAVRG